MINFKEQKDLNLLERLFEIHDDNLYLGDLYNSYFENKEEINEETISEFSTEKNVSENEAFKQLFFKSLYLEDSKETKSKLNEFKVLEINELDPKPYLNNEYYKNVLLSKINIENPAYKLYYKKFGCYEGFIYKDIEVDDDFREINKFAYFKEPFEFIALDKNDVTWMSITPHEINTMEKEIDNAKGNVVIYGLGLGYFLYRVLNKKEVNKVVVIEKDNEIIDIFNKYLKPQFKNLGKLEIIKDDALKFNELIYKDNSKYKFNYSFMDLYHNPVDALYPYINFLKNERDDIKYDYWIEESILAYIRRLIIIILIEELEGFSDKNYKKYTNFEEKVINSLYFYLKGYQFDSFKDLKKFLQNDSLKEIIKNFKLR